MRRGQLDVQFNWIFVLIAGAVILGLFFKVAMTQQQLSQDKAAIRLQNDFDAISNAALQSKDTIQVIPMPKLGLHFGCDGTCACNIKFGRFSVPFDDRSIFTSNSVEGSDARLWVMDWKVPFRVTNMLYITNDQTKYFIVANSVDPLLARLQALLPSEVNYQVISTADEAKNENYANVVFAFINQQPALSPMTLSAFKNANVRIVTANDDPSAEGFGSVDFAPVKKGRIGASVSSAYIGDQMLIGAIFANDVKVYKCSARIAFQRLQGVSSVYLERANQLLGLVGDQSNPLYRCAALYNGIVGGAASAAQCTTGAGPLCAIISASKDVIANEPSQSVIGNAMIVIKDAMTTLTGQNEQLLRESCPTVY